MAVISESSSAAVYSWDATGIITSWDPAAERLFGYSADEVLGHHIHMLAPLDARKTWERVYSRVLGGSRCCDDVIACMHKNGRRFVVEISVSPVVARGAVVGGAVMARDASSRTAAQEVLLDAEARYRSLFEAAPDAILVLDRGTFAVLDANAAALGLFGYAYEELVGMNVAEVSAEPEETLASVTRDDAHVPRRCLRRKDGSTFVAEISGSRLEFDGRIARAVFVRDITGRFEAEEALAASELKFAAAFASSPDAVNITRVEDGMYVEVNEGFSRVTGFSAEETVGHSSLEMDVWANSDDRARMVARLLECGVVDDFEAGFRYKDGGVRFGSMSARVIDLGGVPHVLSVTRDISEKKAAADALEQSYARLAEMVRDMTATLGRVVETRDPYTHGHQERVAAVARAIAEEMGLSADEVEAVGMAALVHDVGKLSVPAEILNKPGELSDVEFGLIKAHSVSGHSILSGVAFPWPMAEIVLQHHERMDGSGYPQGLKGDDILPPARILAIADVVEAMASHRPYRPSLGLESAIGEIRDCPQKYDAAASAACMRLYENGGLEFLRAHREDW